jgi:hypothetical protein
LWCLGKKISSISENLSSNADLFRVRAKGLKTTMWWRECKVNINFGDPSLLLMMQWRFTDLRHCCLVIAPPKTSCWCSWSLQNKKIHLKCSWLGHHNKSDHSSMHAGPVHEVTSSLHASLTCLQFMHVCERPWALGGFYMICFICRYEIACRGLFKKETHEKILETKIHCQLKACMKKYWKQRSTVNWKPTTYMYIMTYAWWYSPFDLKSEEILSSVPQIHIIHLNPFPSLCRCGLSLV